MAPVDRCPGGEDGRPAWTGRISFRTSIGWLAACCPAARPSWRDRATRPTRPRSPTCGLTRSSRRSPGAEDEGDLITGLLGRPVRDIDTLRYRHEVFRDLEDPGLFQAAGQFAAQLRQVRGHLAQLAGMRSGHQREGWFLDAVAIYCDAVRAIAHELEARAIGSRGLTAFRDYLARYVRSAAFEALTADTAARQADLAAITYQVRVKGPQVEVSRTTASPTTARRSRRPSSGSSRAPRSRTTGCGTGPGPA